MVKNKIIVPLLFISAIILFLFREQITDCIFISIRNSHQNDLTVLALLSPDRTNILEIYSQGYYESGITVFNLREVHTKLEKIVLNPFTKSKSNPQGNILVLSGSPYSFQIRWDEGSNLILKFYEPIDKKKLEMSGTFSESVIIKKNQWKNVNIKYEVINKAVFNNSVNYTLR